MGNVLSLTRDITNWGGGYRAGDMLREGASPRTFSQILLAAREAEKKRFPKRFTMKSVPRRLF